jgi:DNA-directed RNA polymerase subunit N (RpoN/RPB10)
MYYRCPSCGTSFAKRYREWIVETDKLRMDKKLNTEERNEKITKLLDKLNLKNICCRSKFITLVNPVRLIK